MTRLTLTTLDRETITLEPAALATLAASVRGPVIIPGDARYDAARSLWNAMFDRRPAMIVSCAGAADVMQTVAFARRHRLLLAVKGGGHHIGGLGSCDGGVLLDLSPMRSVRCSAASCCSRPVAGSSPQPRPAAANATACSSGVMWSDRRTVSRTATASGLTRPAP